MVRVATVGATTDVVAEEDESVRRTGLDPPEESPQGINVAVDIADGDRASVRHRDFSFQNAVYG